MAAMGRSVPILIRAAVIACACAMLLICASAAFAQTSNDDRYGFNPMPAPTMGVAQSQLPPAYPAMQGVPNYPQGAPQAGPQQAPQQYPQQNYGPPQGQVQQGYNPPQGYTQAPPGQAYGYAPLQPNPNIYGPVQQQAMPMQQPMPMQMPQQMGPYQGGYYTQADSRYGTQVAANPNAYYAASSNGQGVASGYMLGPGDKLHVSVFGEDDLTGDYQIDGSGMVRLPLIGTMRAAGYTAPALENAIAGALSQGYLKSPRVNVEIGTYRPIYIIGSVNRPGEYPYVANMSALNAVAYGGGFTEQARQSTVYVRHEGSTVEEAMPASQVTRVWPGDVIRVKNTLFWDAMGIFTPLAGPAALAAAAIH